MPKLPSQAAQAAKKAAEGQSREAIPEGTYECRLIEVKVTTAKKSGNPMWVWTLEIVEEPHRGRRLWVNTVLTEAAMWKVGEMFSAFGADPETADTDEIIGDHCYAEVTVREIAEGARAGQMGNDVNRCTPMEGASGAPVTATAAAADAASGDAPAAGW